MSLSKYTGRNRLESLHRNPGTLARECQEGVQASEQERLEALKMIAGLLERLVQAGVSWSEIYQLVTQASEVLGKNDSDVEPKKSVVSRFRKAVDRVKQAVSVQMENWTTSIASSLSRLVRSSTFRTVVNSLLAIALSLQLTSPVLAADSKQNTLAPSIKAALVDSSGLGSQDATVFSLSRIADAEAPDGQSEAENFDLEASLEILDQHGYLDYLLKYVISEAELNNQEQVKFSKIAIRSKENGQLLINYNKIFAGRLSLNKDGKLEFVNQNNVPVAGAIGIVAATLPYGITIDGNGTSGPSIQYLSGVTHSLGHCCGVDKNDDNYRAFANLGRLQPDDLVVITTTNELKYQFLVRIVGNVPKEYSMGMVYSDYKTALKFIAAVLLSTPEKPASEEILTQVEQILNKSQNVSSAIESLQELLERNGVNENLTEILQAFIEGRAMILMTCDSEATSRTSTGELVSDNRILAIVGLEPGQKPPEFLRPAVFVGSLNESVKEDKEFIKTMIRALYKRFPAIVKKWVQEIIKRIPNTSETKPTPTTDPVSRPTPDSNSDTGSIGQNGTQSPPQPQLSEEERIQKQIQERIARLQWLNSQVEPVLPPIPLMPQSGDIDLNKFINDIVLGHNSASFIELIKFFVEPERLTVLQEYIQVLEDLTLVAEGENAQYLQDFLYKLKLVQLLVENSLTIGSTGLVLTALLFFARRK